MNLEQQAEFLAMTYDVEQLEATLKVLLNAQTKITGGQGRIDSESIQVVKDALHLRLVQERIELALEEAQYYVEP